MNTNYVDTLLRQLGEGRVDGNGASRKGVLVKIEARVLVEYTRF